MSAYKIISFLNMKGGVGKTTLAVNVAATLVGRFNKQVLLVDIDPQFNSTQYLVDPQRYLRYLENEKNLTILDIFRDSPLTLPRTTGPGSRRIRPEPTRENTTLTVLRNRTTGKNLDLIPSNLELMALETSDRGTERKLATFLNRIKDAYDYIIIDCPPTTSIFTLSAYLASDAIVIPVKPDHLSSIGLPLLNNLTQRYSLLKETPVINLGVIFNMVNLRYNLDKNIMKSIRESNIPVFTHFLRNSTNIARAVQARRPIYLFYKSRREHGTDIINITQEFILKTEGR